MGLNVNATKLLLKLRSEGFEFGNVITLGRQRLNLTKANLQKNLDQFGINADPKELKKRNNGYCESFLELLGATKVDSIDFSNYENATLIHDLNAPLPSTYFKKFQTVIDSGTLEHVFNFPQAIRNCMELLSGDGHYIGITPCNNFFGHGFYQFSPGLYYRIFSPANGFRVEQMYFFIDDPSTNFYEVKDPAQVRERVLLNNVYPSFLFVVARRIEVKELFTTTPQQSDYEHIIWKKNARRIHRFIPKPLRKLPRPLRKIVDLYNIMRKQTGTADPRFFTKRLAQDLSVTTLLRMEKDIRE